MEVIYNSNFQIEYTKLGNGEQNLIFLHGGGLGYDCYENVIRSLAEKFTVYALNLPGYGRSKNVGNLEETGKQVAEFIDALGITKATIVGHSYGGGVSLYAAKHSENIERLVFIDGAGIPIRRSKLRMILGFFIFKNLQGIILDPRLMIFYFKAIIRIFKNIWIQKTAIPKTIKNVVGAIDYELNIPEDFAVKTLILWGKQDYLIPLKYGEILQKKIKDSKLKVFPGNHDWFVFEEETLRREIEEMF